MTDSINQHNPILTSAASNNNNNNSNISTANSSTTNTPEFSPAILELLKRTDYPLVQENGQRRYGPPKNWVGEVPRRGCEIFVGKLPRDCFEDELVPILEKFGRLYECRIMVDFDKGNRGFCFATYANREEAKTASKEMNNYEIREKRYIGACQSVDNCRLFVGGIPLDKKEEDVVEAMKQMTEGVVRAIVYSSVADKTKNRGFAFVEYESHKAAAVARRKLMTGRVSLWGQQVAVDWAEPETEIDDDVMSKVKILYIRNLMTTTTEEIILQAVVQALNGRREAVKKLKDFAFVHFKERDDALRVMQALDNTTMDGSRIEVVLAKPANKETNTSSNSFTASNMFNIVNGTSKLMISPTYPPVQTSPFLTGSPYYPFGGDALISNNQQFNSYPLSPPPLSTMTSSTSASFQKFRGGQGMRRAGGMSRTYGQKGKQNRLYDLHPGVELVPVSPHTLKPISSKSPVQLLEELCQRNGWESPVYQLHSTISNCPNEQQLFVHKVLISNINSNPFMASKLCRNVDEAKRIAAENVLMSLGVSCKGTFPSIHCQQPSGNEFRL
ncbi:hypothetical protein HELRODRAFT_112672 [Helobdella robusta]|uniref:RNA-binding protein 46 n=1 Tax=Helobdella robusta TaxID=6412 RepID=T1EFL2_HELRO|nr:hypothetical protein HELRODRAFT_112672 [Helobdella robusta]ESO01760.1 hypothetical protein HELRODRAFT_112672 [Helobdella robusta]